MKCITCVYLLHHRWFLGAENMISQYPRHGHFNGELDGTEKKENLISLCAGPQVKSEEL